MQNVTSPAPNRGSASLATRSCKYGRWNQKKWTSVEKMQESHVCCAVCSIFVRQILEFFRTSTASLDPQTVQQLTLYILQMYTPCLLEHVAHQRSTASLWCSARTFCAWLWNSNCHTPGSDTAGIRNNHNMSSLLSALKAVQLTCLHLCLFFALLLLVLISLYGERRNGSF